MAFFNQDYIDFFIELGANNHKEWFDENRKRYESNVRDPFKAFVNHLISEISKNHPEYKHLESKHCMFRINRDIRFSKDKTPYKTNLSALITPEGKSKHAAKGVYFELSPEHVRVYGGIYEVDKDGLYFIREGIANQLDAFKKLYNDKKFANTFGELRGEKNKIIPKEFKEAGEQEPLIYNKQWYYFAEYGPEYILRDDLDRIIINDFETGQPLQNFFQQLIHS